MLSILSASYVRIKIKVSETYSEPIEKSKMKLFTKIVNDFPVLYVLNVFWILLNNCILGSLIYIRGYQTEISKNDSPLLNYHV